MEGIWVLVFSPRIGPSQLPYWSSAGVPARETCGRGSCFNLKGLCCCQAPHAADRGLFSRKIRGTEGVFASIRRRRKNLDDGICTIKSNQIKSLLLSHHHSTSALVSEILMSVLQTVQKKQQTIYIWTDSAKKTALEHLQCSRQCKKKNIYIYIWTDSAKKQQTIYIWTVHIYRLYRKQCAKYTYIYSVHIVYYKDTLNYQRHIIQRMGTSTLCTVSIHNVVYT